MTYSEKLRDPRWQKKRLLILDRDGWKCFSCGDSTRNLQVRHVVYRRMDPWEYPDSLLQTLCDACHKERQELSDKSADALRIAIMKVPTQRLHVIAQRIIAEAMKGVG
jgi:5-methylcytosine-specific restriction endonuclease McrA